MDDRNIFSLLFKWARSTKESDGKTQNENYCTQALTIVLSQLLNRSSEGCRLQAVGIIESLFAEHVGFSFENNDRIIVEAHKKTSGGIPDLTIQTENGEKLIYVEIKVDSPVDDSAEGRIRNYARALSENTQAINKGLLLVTRSGHEPVTSIDRIRFAQISWFDVSGQLLHAWTELNQRENAGLSAIFLLGQFYDFLKEGGMAILKVDNNLQAATVYNVIKLLRMLEYVFNDRELKICKRGRPWFEAEAMTEDEDSCLCYLNKKDGDYGVSIYAENPVGCYFEIRQSDEIRRLFPFCTEEELSASRQRIKTQLDENAYLWVWNGDATIAVNLDLGFGLSGEGVTELDQVTRVRERIKHVRDRWEQLKGRHRGRSR